MLRDYDERKLIEQILKDMELPPEELKDILEKELDKPAEDMDVDLIDDLLDLLEIEGIYF